MSDPTASQIDDYCRQIEDYLTRTPPTMTIDGIDLICIVTTTTVPTRGHSDLEAPVVYVLAAEHAHKINPETYRPHRGESELIHDEWTHQPFPVIGVVSSPDGPGYEDVHAVLAGAKEATARRSTQ